MKNSNRIDIDAIRSHYDLREFIGKDVALKGRENAATRTATNRTEARLESERQVVVG